MCEVPNAMNKVENLPDTDERQVDATVSLPTVDKAGVIAVSISEHLTAQEQSFFIAGFQECIKWLNAAKTG